MKFKIGDKVIYSQRFLGYIHMKNPAKYKGEIVEYSSGTDKVFGEYEVSYLNFFFNGYERCVVSEEDLSFDLETIRDEKIKNILTK